MTNGFIPFLRALTQSEIQRNLSKIELMSTIPFPTKISETVSENPLSFLDADLSLCNITRYPRLISLETRFISFSVYCPLTKDCFLVSFCIKSHLKCSSCLSLNFNNNKFIRFLNMPYSTQGHFMVANICSTFRHVRFDG